MKLIFGLMLLKTAACLEVNCSFYQKDPCYAALGHKLNLKMLDASKYNLKIQKKITSTQNHSVCRVKDGRINENECDLFNKRSEVSVINGILIINGVIRADSGTYRLEDELRNGTDTADLQVIVEDPLVIPIVLGCLAVILVALVITAYYFYKKKNQIKSTNILPEKRKDEEVRYGEVTFTNSSVQQPRKKTQQDCVYSEVHTR
ncbi:uncharacterized protein LOC125261137 [Megalobrama amblycephala]|uniref:uncharacterized protein LOC125261137 n=1 Tax=Megalobrama amblycephala TaxID=75352 RepID=UPI00201444C7|nr:uncharacterized protein LOC125261137 [Megalobrama amblycephala]